MMNPGTAVALACRDDTLNVLFVMATVQEYGPGLKRRIDPLITGVGPVEAAAVTVHRLADLKAAQKPVDLLVSLGSAGSSVLDQGEIYQARSVSYRDMDASPLGFEKGRTPFLDLAAELPIRQQLDGIAAASLSTGANIVSGDAYGAIGADMVDMETFAIMRAAHRFDIPLIGLRGISDGRDPVSRYEDWTRYLEDIDAKLADITDRLESLFSANDKAYWTALPEGL
jgi:adenosylhomocysteine nucleosidase